MEHEPFIADIVPTKCFFILYLHILLHYITLPEGNPPPKKKNYRLCHKTPNNQRPGPVARCGQWPVTQRVPWDPSAPPESDRPMSAAVAEALPRNFQRWRS